MTMKHSSLKSEKTKNSMQKNPKISQLIKAKHSSWSMSVNLINFIACISASNPPPVHKVVFFSMLLIGLNKHLLLFPVMLSLGILARGVSSNSLKSAKLHAFTQISSCWEVKASKFGSSYLRPKINWKKKIRNEGSCVCMVLKNKA